MHVNEAHDVRSAVKKIYALYSHHQTLFMIYLYVCTCNIHFQNNIYKNNSKFYMNKIAFFGTDDAKFWEQKLVSFSYLVG